MNAIRHIAMASLGLLAALGASSAQAAVIYELTDPGPSLVYTSADFVTAERTVNAGDLTSDNFNPGQVASVTFSPGVFANILVNFTALPCTPNLYPICQTSFLQGSFAQAGMYRSITSTDGRASFLQVYVQGDAGSPVGVPEPASLALLGVGLACLTLGRSHGASRAT